jgi:hypothetical protein
MYLDVFGVELFIQWEALDGALVTGVERSQLQPLVGGIPEREQENKRGGQRGVCVCPERNGKGVHVPVADGDQEVFRCGGEEFKVSDVQLFHLDGLTQLYHKPRERKGEGEYRGR